MSSSLWILLIIELIHYILHILRRTIIHIPVVVIFFIFIITFLIITFIFFLWNRHLIIFIRIIIFIFGKLIAISIVIGTIGISKSQTIFRPIIYRSSSSTRSTRNFIISFKIFHFLISFFTRTIFRKVRKVSFERIFESFTINFFSFWWVTCSLSLFLWTWTTVIWAATTRSSIRLFRSFIRYSLGSWLLLWLFSWFFCIISLTTSS